MLNTVVVPIDGSAPAQHALDHAIALAKSLDGGALHLVNVQPAVDSLVTTFVGQAEVTDYHRDEGMKALKPAEDRCKAAGIAPKLHIGVGKAGPVIIGFAKSLGAGQIVMGARGLGGTAGLLLGSVSRDVIAEAPVPVTVVK